MKTMRQAGVGIAALAFWFSAPAFGFIDLTTAGSSSDYFGAIFTQTDTKPAGTGVFDTFVRIQVKGEEQGYNTSGRPVPFDEKTDPFTHDLQLNELSAVNVGGTDYYSFKLDINEPGAASKSKISLDALQIYTSPTGGKTTSNLNLLGNLRYNLDANGDTFILLDAKIGAPGSGNSDMLALIPKSAFAGALSTDFVYLYSHFGASARCQAGFEEWAAHHVVDHVIPEPGTITLVGAGLLGVLVFLRRRSA
jgi:hypothetical protein